MSFTPGHIAKSGWLLRQSSILKRWKKSYVVFYTDGRLAYFDSERSAIAEDVINIPCDQVIILGPEYCKEISPPDGKSSNLIFGLKTREKAVYFCVDNSDELLTWKLALQEAFNIQAFYRHVGMDSCNQFTYHVPPGSTIVVGDRGPMIYQPDGQVIHVCDQPYFRSHTYETNFCTGMLAGAALGSFMFWPWWFFWF